MQFGLSIGQPAALAQHLSDQVALGLRHQPFLAQCLEHFVGGAGKTGIIGGVGDYE